MDEPELRRHVADLNREAREDGRLEPVVVSDDGTRVTWVGSPRRDATVGAARLVNGEAAPGGVDGRILYCGPGTLLTLEPTNPGDVEVHAWARVDGHERPGTALGAAQLRDLAADLTARADLIDPRGGES